jgi:phosphatidate phosphatase APP1
VQSTGEISEPDPHQSASDATSSRESAESGEDLVEDDTDGRLRTLARSVGTGFDRATKSRRTAGVVAGIEDWAWRTRRERKIGKGTLRATFVVAYRGYVADGRAYLRVRVMEEPVIPPPAEAITDTSVLKSNLRRFVALSFPGVKVQLSLAGTSEIAESGRHGYATAQVHVGDLAPGWHDYQVRTQPDDPTEEPTIVTGRVLAPDPSVGVAVVSDLDDTVIKTGLGEGVVALRRTLFGQAETREPIPGMAALYQAVQSGPRSSGPACFYYLSTGPWNLYDMLTEFLELRGFPAGPLFLTDWGPQERYVTRSGREHKRKSLRRLFDLYPETSFVLIGDSGQKDPDVYLEVAGIRPNQVRAIIIIDAGEHAAERGEELRERGPELQAEGVPFYFAEDARDAAEFLLREGLVDRNAPAAVRRAYTRDIEKRI